MIGMDGLLRDVTVLIVDDEERNLDLLGDVMSGEGYRTLFASNGLEAIDVVNERHAEIDLILLDVMMPQLDGFATCKRLRQMDSSAGIPILLVTALAGQRDRLRGIGAGANDFLTKPLQIVETRLRVRNCILQKRLTDAVKKDLFRLQDLERMRDTLVHMVVHDLRSPLTNLMLSMELLLASPLLSEGDGELVRDAQLASERLMQLVNTMLDVSRLESGEFPIHLRSDCMVETLRTTIDRSRRVSGSRVLTLETPLDEHVMAFDVDVVTRVVENLIQNAIKATSSNGHITVKLSIADGRALVEVQDDGHGIPAEQRARVFEKFSRAAQPETARRAPGWGLGLSFVSMAIQAHGGAVGLDSEEGEGSRFWFSIPDGVSPEAPRPEPAGSS
jgi:two-component system sensor histidine kinase/response regulator